jgi:glycosyltransferase involved in cell wall biosynthesis
VKISVITASLNRKQFIRAAIESVLAQKFSDFEHWIIDGGSTDGTLDLLKEYPHLRVVSGPDNGVYDAWNKGISCAAGDVIAFLNSDDVYPEGVFEAVADLFAKSSALVASGGAEIFQRLESGKEVQMHRYVDPGRYHLSLQNVTLGLPIINARFFRKIIFAQIGPFDLRYPVASDRHFLIRSAAAGMRDVSTSQLFYRYRWHATSLTMNAGNASMLRAVDDGLAIIEEIRHAHHLDFEQEAVLSEWWRELQATKVMTFAVMGKASAAINSAALSMKKDPRWLLTFLRCGSLAVGRRMRTSWRTVT